MFDENRFHMTSQEVEGVLSLAKMGPPFALLDLCCGPGRHAIEFAKLGCAVTGVDRTPRYLDRARKSAGAVEVAWVEQDVRHFERPQTFDLAINLYTSFGYFESPEDDGRVAANVFQSLKPGGKFIISTMSKETIAKTFVERTWDQRGALIVIDERQIHPEFAAIENRWTILDGSDRHELGFVVRLYAASEMRSLLQQSGFETVRFYGNLSGAPYDQDARRMVVVATKTG